MQMCHDFPSSVYSGCCVYNFDAPLKGKQNMKCLKRKKKEQYQLATCVTHM